MITKIFLKIIATSSLPKDQQSRVVDKPIFRIGRDLDNDWVLPSPDRLISRHHCVIEHINNTFTLSDLSKNGVFINNSPSPIGLGNSGVLSDGDILILPGLKISVTFSEDQTSQASDPFLALLPTREDGAQTNKRQQETINAAVINLNQSKSDAYDFLKDRASLPIFTKLADISSSEESWQTRTKPNFERLPAERDSFRSAMPKTTAIPEDWYKEEDTAPQSQLSIRTGKDTRINSENYNPAPKLADLHTKLLLELISKFSEIERSISITGKSDIASILNERSLEFLKQEDFDTAVGMIEKITQRCIKQTDIRKLHSSETPQEVNKLSSNDIIDQILQKNNEASEVEKTIDIPMTGGNINELEQ